MKRYANLTRRHNPISLCRRVLLAASVTVAVPLAAGSDAVGGVPRLPVDERAAIAAAAPVVFEHTADAGPDQTFFLTGERLGKEVFVWGRSAGNSGGEASLVRFLTGNADWLTANLDITAYNGPFLVWVRNDAGWSRPIRLNVPEVWWCWPAKPTPGQTLRLVGRDLAQRPDRTAAHVWLARPGHEGQWLAIQKAGKYELHVGVPRDLVPGRCQLWLHAGHGGRYGWSEPMAIEVAKPASVPAREVKAPPPSRQAKSQDLNAALEQLVRKGGGTLRLAPGDYCMKETLRVLEDRGWVQRDPEGRWSLTEEGHRRADSGGPP